MRRASDRRDRRVVLNEVAKRKASQCPTRESRCANPTILNEVAKRKASQLQRLDALGEVG